MPQHFILSVISDDKPGIVKHIAQVISDHGGSWQESQLAQLAGKFAGVVRISIDAQKADDLTAALEALKAQGITITVEALSTTEAAQPSKSAAFTLAGPDRNGIVRELAQAFALHNINVEEISTRCSSMPYSGDPLFEAEGTLNIPTNTNWDDLMEQVNKVADDLALDIHLEPSA